MAAVQTGSATITVSGRVYLWVTLVLLFLSACGKKPERRTTELPAKRDSVVTAQRETVRMNVVYPLAGQLKPKVDSNFIFGSVSDRSSALTINGFPVPVAPSGGFLAFLPMPVDGKYTLVARYETGSDTLHHAYKLPQPSESTPKPADPTQTLTPTPVTIVRTSDTLQTGSDVVPGSPSPGADRKWLFPRGTRAIATAQQGSLIQLMLATGVHAWVADTNVQFDSMPALPSVTSAQVAGTPSFNSYSEYVDVRVPCDYAPFLVEVNSPRAVSLVLYARRAPQGVVGGNIPDTIIPGFSWDESASTARLNLVLQQPLWGYKVFYDALGAVIFRLRRPPVINDTLPLLGRTILVDPGHPPLGATGPTGLTEADANLAISLRLEEKLRAKGARVLMTRRDRNAPRSNTNSAIDLWARAEMAVNQNAEVLVSVHNNAFPDGVNPFLNYGTSTYYYHPHSADLSSALLYALLPATQIRNIGSKQRSLAVVRPTWMPTALTESLYMMFPEQEMMLRDPAFVDRLAEAHATGLENFFRQRGAAARSLPVEK